VEEARPLQKPLSDLEQQTLTGQDNAPIARINGKALPHWMFDNAARDKLVGQTPEDKERYRIEKEIIDNLIDMELLSADAARLGLSVGGAGGQLRLAIVERSYKSPEEFDQSLAKAGMTRRQYADLWQQQATVNRLVEEKIQVGVTVSDQELEETYKEQKERFQRPPQVRASHILIKVDETTTEEERTAARSEARALRSQLENGADFAELARQHSACPSGKKGGDLGWFAREKMEATFAEAAFALENGELSQVVKSSFGFHIIQKTGERPAGPAPLEEVRCELTEALIKAKTKVALDRYLAELRAKVDIEIYDDNHG
jgi:peptidyl-prolyl cis-trans isomerase C